MPLVRRGPNPVTRVIDEPMVTGVRAVYAALTLGKGQRMAFSPEAESAKVSCSA